MTNGIDEKQQQNLFFFLIIRLKITICRCVLITNHNEGVMIKNLFIASIDTWKKEERQALFQKCS